MSRMVITRYHDKDGNGWLAYKGVVYPFYRAGVLAENYKHSAMCMIRVIKKNGHPNCIGGIRLGSDGAKSRGLTCTGWYSKG